VFAPAPAFAPAPVNAPKFQFNQNFAQKSLQQTSFQRLEAP